MKFLLFLLLSIIPFSIYAKWEPCNNGLNGAEISALDLIDNTAWVGTTNGNLFKSTDMGKQWMFVFNAEGSSIIAISVEAEKICLATPNKVFVSVDGGNYFESKWVCPNYLHIHSILIKNNKFFLGTETALYQSTNYGMTWVQYSNQLQNISSFYAKDSIIYACTGKGIKGSTDNGLNWDIDLSDVVVDRFLISQDKFYACQKYAFLTSLDSGKTWSKWYTMSGAVANDMVALNDTVIISTDKNLYSNHLTDDPWHGFENLAWYNFTCIGVMNNTVFAGSKSGVFISSDYFKTYEISTNNFEETTVTNLLELNGSIITSTKYNSAFISTDFGDSWSNDSAGLNRNFINCLSKSNDTAYAGTDMGLFFSDTLGKAWKKIKDLQVKKLAVTGNNFVFTDSLDIFYSHDGCASVHDVLTDYEGINVIAAFKDKFYVGASSFFISTDYGKSWISKNEYQPYFNPVAIAINDDYIYAGISNQGIYYSTNNGDTWTGGSPGLTSRNVSAIVILPGAVLAATDSGIFCSHNKGDYWFSFNDGLENQKITTLITAGNYVYAGTVGKGIFRIKADDVTSVGETEIPSRLLSISPNPASDYIIITLPSDAHTLKGVVEGVRLYDVFGQDVSDGLHLEGGEHLSPNVRIDVSALPAGVYFVRVGDKVSKFVKI